MSRALNEHGKDNKHGYMKPKELKILEKDVLKACLEWLQYNGVFAFRLNNTGLPTSNGGFRPPAVRGLPDIIAYIPRPIGFAIPVMIECKAPGGKLSPYQEQFLGDADHAKILVVVTSSVEFLEETLKPYL